MSQILTTLTPFVLILTALPAASFSAEKTCTCTPESTSKAFSSVAKKATPAVVFIKVQGQAGEDEFGGYPSYPNGGGSGGGGSGSSPFEDDFFRHFFGGPQKPQKPAPQASQGSGFLVSADGYILTNAHVVKGADKIVVVLNDGREMDASVIGSDSHTDIAIIKIEGKNFPFLTLGNSDGMDIGEWVVAIGSPFQLESSLTVGVISAKGRQNLRITDLEDFLQTDAAINPGNSGGPLLNLQSEVIGINTAIVSRSGGYMGIGFAIPSNMAKNIMNQLIDKGTVVRGFLGVSLQPLDKELADAFNLEKIEGALVSEVAKDSPADKAGIKQGDIIVEYNGIPVKSLGSFRNEIGLTEPGKVIKLKINRKGQILAFSVSLGSANDNVTTASGVAAKLGIEIENMSPQLSQQLGYVQQEEGVVITKVKPGSSASMAGLRPGFLIQAVNHKKIATINDFNDALTDAGKNKRILLLIRQGNITRFYSIRLD